MPIETKYDSTIDAIVMKATGRIIYDDISDLAENIVAHPEFRINIDQLFDIAHGEFDLSTGERVPRFRHRQRHPPEGKIIEIEDLCPNFPTNKSTNSPSPPSPMAAQR